MVGLHDRLQDGRRRRVLFQDLLYDACNINKANLSFDEPSNGDFIGGV